MATPKYQVRLVEFDGPLDSYVGSWPGGTLVVVDKAGAVTRLTELDVQTAQTAWAALPEEEQARLTPVLRDQYPGVLDTTPAPPQNTPTSPQAPVSSTGTGATGAAPSGGEPGPSSAGVPTAVGGTSGLPSSPVVTPGEGEPPSSPARGT